MKKLFLIILVLYLQFAISNIYSQGEWLVYTIFNSGLPNNGVNKVIFDSNNAAWIGTVDGLAKFDGINWTVYDTSNSPLPDARIRDMVFEGNSLWIATQGKGLVKFDGTNWTIYDTLNSGLPNDICYFIFLENNIKWVGTIRGLAKFNDTSWIVYNTINSGIPSNFLVCGILENNIKWIGTQGNGISKFDNFNWTTYNFQNSGLPSDAIRGITIDYLGNKWIATRFGGLARFNSNLNSWTVYNTSNSGIPENNLYSVFTQNHIKWVGTLGSGLAEFNDTTWTVFNPSNSPLPDISVVCLSADRLGNLWIGTAGGLAEYNPNQIIGIKNENENVPQSFRLYQNYPNPFNPTTTIRYDIPRDGMVSVKIYDILGREVYSINEFRATGHYEMKFDGTNYASGLYFYRLEAGSFIQTKKMVLVK